MKKCDSCAEKIAFLKKQMDSQPFPQSYFTLKGINILELKLKGFYKCPRGSNCRYVHNHIDK